MDDKIIRTVIAGLGLPDPYATLTARLIDPDHHIMLIDEARECLPVDAKSSIYHYMYLLRKHYKKSFEKPPTIITHSKVGWSMHLDDKLRVLKLIRSRTGSVIYGKDAA